MKLIHQVSDLPAEGKGPAVAIGNLDGVHRGHQALIASAKACAHSLHVPTAVLTFTPHPQAVLRPTSQGMRLTTDPERYALFEKHGVDLTLALPFTVALAELEAEVFLERYLGQGLRATSLHVGQDFRFGRGRAGNSTSLRLWGESRGMEVCIIDAVTSGDEKISSSSIRALIQQGQVAQANRLLGYAYEHSGSVEKGAGRGRTLGIPTANVAYDPSKVAPCNGVYLTRTQVGGRAFVSVSNFGSRPTFVQGDPRPTLETHLLDFSESIYGQTVRVEFIDRLREERKFENVDALRAQVMTDIETARKKAAATF